MILYIVNKACFSIEYVVVELLAVEEVTKY